MIIESDKIPDIEMLVSLLKHFDITIEGSPQLPISFSDLVQYLVAQKVSVDKINAVINHINTSANLFGGANREREKANVWPDPSRDPTRCVSDELFWAMRKPVVTRSSKIVSLGSCFAIELAKWLQINGYNYIVKEPNLLEGTDLHGASARWGTIFNAFGFYQVVSWAFGFDLPPLVCYKLGEQIRDPFREDVTYSQAEIGDLKQIWEEHLRCSRAALEEADVIVLTVGLNEVFKYLPTGHYLHRTPWGMNPAVWAPQILTVDDNYNILKLAIERLRQFNPSVKFIISVSPVPLMRTFRRDVHVATATSHSKAVLRTAVEQLCATVPDVHYMASFETVMFPGTKIRAWDDDERHVTEEIVRKVMRLFEQQFCAIEDALVAARRPYAKEINEFNPYFETDHKIFCQALSECVAQGYIDSASALDLVNKATPVLYKGTFNNDVYMAVRAMSIKSRLNFNLICRELYRQAYPTTFPSNPNSQAIADSLENKGLHVLKANNQSKAIAIDLIKHIQTCKVRRELDGKIGYLDALINEGMEGSFRFIVPEEDLPLTEIMGLYKDSGILKAIGDHIGHPILRSVSAWYSMRPQGYKMQHEGYAAQMYHFDNDTPAGWTKVFIYLTDVSAETGPHVFIPKSHKELPQELARDGRFSDQEAEAVLGKGEVLTGDIGTIIVADTQGFHKGLTPQSGMRLVFQMEFVTNLLGAETPTHGRPYQVLSELGGYDSRFLRRHLSDSYRE